MVKIAIAGGAGNVASEIVDALVATNSHEIVILTRRDPSTNTPNASLSYAKTDYTDINELAQIFKGVHTVLSFLAPHDQEEGIKAQQIIIDACVKAGVKRFAPSEWGSTGLDHMPWYTFKGAARTYLADLNKDKKVLEYSLFQPGLFTDYLAIPYMKTKHVKALETPFDFEKRRMLLAEGPEVDTMVFTTVKDLANVVVRAVEYEGAWPVVGGIKGSKVTMKQLIELGEKFRGGKFDVETFSAKEFADATWNPTWCPQINHPSIPRDLVESISKAMVAGILLAIKAKAFDVNDEWNKLLPDYEFENVETVLAEAWSGKP